MGRGEPLLSFDDLRFIGSGLVRPECVLATATGDLYSSDWRGGVSHIRPDGSQALYASQLPEGRPLRPNGIALLPGGDFLLADLGEQLGGIFTLSRSGQAYPFLIEVDGQALPPTNFVSIDSLGRLWVTVSTSRRPRAQAYRKDVADGFIVMLEAGKQARIVAEGLGYTNEALVSPDGRHLYANETFARRLSRFPIAADGTLGSRETVAEFGPGVFPDGLAFDREGAVWVASIVANRVERILPDGQRQLILEDPDPEHVARCEEAFQAGRMGRPHLDGAGASRLGNTSSIAFGGPELKTVHLGCLLTDRIATFTSPVAGHPPVHWGW